MPSAGDAAEAEADVPPGPVDLSAAGVRVVIEPDPFSYTVYDEAGEVRLRSLATGAGDGYGALGWTLGDLAWSTSISPGYANFRAELEPWRDDFVVVEADTNADRADLVLAPRGSDGRPDPAGPRVLVSFLLRASAVRVEASVETGTPRAWSAAFATPSDEGFLGLGERFTRTNHRGLNVYSWAEEGGIGGGEGSTPGPTNPFPNGESMAYYPVPFFVSTAGYGFWLDSTWRNEFNLATARDDAWRGCCATRAASARRARCWRRSMAGSARGSTPTICWRRGNCWTRSTRSSTRLRSWRGMRRPSTS